MQTNQSSEQPVGPQVGTNLGAQPGAQAGNQANPQAEAKQPAFNSASVQSAADLITAIVTEKGVIDRPDRDRKSTRLNSSHT